LAGVLEGAKSDPLELSRRVGRRIRELRERQGMTLLDLAKRAGISPGALSCMENGKKGIMSDDLFRLAKLLRVKPIEFFRDECEVDTDDPVHGIGPTGSKPLDKALCAKAFADTAEELAWLHRNQRDVFRDLARAVDVLFANGPLRGSTVSSKR